MATRRSRLKVKPNILRPGGSQSTSTAGGGRSAGTKPDKDIPISVDNDSLASNKEACEPQASSSNIENLGQSSVSKDVPASSPRKRKVSLSDPGDNNNPKSPRKRRTSGNVEVASPGSPRKRNTSGSGESVTLPQVHSPRTRSVSRSDDKTEIPLSPQKNKSITSETGSKAELEKPILASASRRRSTKVVPNMTVNRPGLARKAGTKVSDEVKSGPTVGENLNNDQSQKSSSTAVIESLTSKDKQSIDGNLKNANTGDCVIETTIEVKKKDIQEDKKAKLENEGIPDEKNKEHLENVEGGKKEMPVDPGSKPSIGLTRRRFNRAKPNIGDIGRSRVRHASVSGSEVDGHIEPNKPPPVTRISLTETSSASESGATPKTGDTPDLLKLPVPATAHEEAVTTEKNIGRRASRYVDDEAPKRKRRKMEKLTTIDRTKLTMRDLIYMNPVNNPMKSSLENPEKILKEKTDEGQGSRRNSFVSHTEGDAQDDTRSEFEGGGAPPKRNESVDTLGSDGEGEEEKSSKDEEKEEENLLVPQVKIDANGQIILNEASLVVDNPNNSVENEDMTLVHENENNFTCSYGRKTTSKSWTLSETKKFYLALSAVGTDFSLMDKLFPHRSRTELKRKFKREDKVNRVLVDKAIAGDRQVFDLAFFEEVAAFDLKAAEEEEMREKKERRKKAAAPRRKRASSDDVTKKKKVPTATLR